MSCVLRVGGSGFDVDEFLRHSSLKITKVFHEGERCGLSSEVRDLSGFNAEVSNKDFDNLEGQIDEAIHFVKMHRNELETIKEMSGVEGHLDFGVESRTGKVIDEQEIAVWSICFPVELLKLLGKLDIGIEVTVYP